VSIDRSMIHIEGKGCREAKIISVSEVEKALVALEDRPRSRFGWRLDADIQPPDIEMRVAILPAKAGRVGAQVPNDVLAYITRKIPSNIHEMEGALNWVLAHARLMHRLQSLETAQGRWRRSSAARKRSWRIRTWQGSGLPAIARVAHAAKPGAGGVGTPAIGDVPNPGGDAYVASPDRRALGQAGSYDRHARLRRDCSTVRDGRAIPVRLASSQGAAGGEGVAGREAALALEADYRHGSAD